jgi:hypothetical protein
MTFINLRDYPEELLQLLEPLPALHQAVIAERARRAEHQHRWNHARCLAAFYHARVAYRAQYGWSINEAARGVDERESDENHAIWCRLRFLRRRSLWRLHQRHTTRVRGGR